MTPVQVYLVKLFIRSREEIKKGVIPLAKNKIGRQAYTTERLFAKRLHSELPIFTYLPFYIRCRMYSVTYAALKIHYVCIVVMGTALSWSELRNINATTNGNLFS